MTRLSAFLLVASVTAAAQSNAQDITPDTALTTVPVSTNANRMNAGEGQTLEDFFLSAMEYSPRLQIARDQWDVGTARKDQATGQLLPQINASANVTENRQRAQNELSEYRGERFSLQLRQVLFDWAAFKERSATGILEDQAEAEYYAELSLVLTEVAETYFEALQAEDALHSVQSELNATQTQLEQFERLYDLEMIQITDLYEAQANVAEVEAEQIMLDSEVRIAREALRSISGLAVGELYRMDEDASVPRVEGTVQEWVEEARQSNFEVQARSLAVNAADVRVSQQRSVYMPQVSLIAMGQQSNVGYDNSPLGRETDTTYLGIDVTIPLFAGGSNRASVREALSQRSMAQNELRQISLDISEQARLTFLQLRALERRIEAAETLVEARRITAEARQRGFELGTVTSVDVLDAVRDRFAAERELQTQRYEYLKLSLYLRQYAGTLSIEDLTAISNILTTQEISED